jgi:glutamate synthase (NADPH/NADH)
VFPYEYQRAMRQLAEEAAQDEMQEAVNGKPNESKVRDIEESVLDGAFEKKRLEKILDKTRHVPEVE